ncbi:MAG: PLDc N-terminal domain-containing protein [Eubacterium sp.]|nr:PLDc N-terminal domain-containing protein [Eubacterium sp.]MCR4845157.1 PLDc N-terminal domain-containing protein [Eubacterium sp.]
MDTIREWLPFIIPLAIAEIILLIVTLVHIFKHPNYKRGNRALWVIVTIIGMEFIGPILYFTLGKGED